MSILNFVTQEQLENLDDDPRVAFMEIVNHAQRSLSSQLERIDQSQEDEWRRAEEVRHSFMNVIVAASKQYEVEPFASMEVPRLKDNLDFQQFRADLDHYVTQLILSNSAQTRRDSVSILPKSKDRIRSHIHGLRECIEKANMTDAKRSALLRRLDELEAELEKRRANMLLVAKLAFEIMALPSGVWGSYDIATKLLANISQTVEESREAEQANRVLPVVKAVPALSPPRKPKPAWGELDDDVPF